MNKETQLAEAKRMAKMFLNLPVTSGEIPIFVQHPFFENAVLMDKDGLFDVFEESERYKQFKLEFFDRMISQRTNIGDIVTVLRKPYQLVFLNFLLKGKIISKKECGNLLANNWSLIEVLNHDKNVTKLQVLSWIKAADKEILMNPAERAIYDSLPDSVTAYRGCKSAKGIKGLSWTLSRDVAEFFKDRFGKGKLYQAQINKADVIAYLNDRDEHEVIVDYRKLLNIIEVTKAHQESC